MAELQRKPLHGVFRENVYIRCGAGLDPDAHWGPTIGALTLCKSVNGATAVSLLDVLYSSNDITLFKSPC